MIVLLFTSQWEINKPAKRREIFFKVQNICCHLQGRCVCPGRLEAIYALKLRRV